MRELLYLLIVLVFGNLVLSHQEFLGASVLWSLGSAVVCILLLIAGFKNVVLKKKEKPK